MLPNRFKSETSLITIILLGAFLLYFKTIGFDFADYDDNVYVTNNKYVKDISLKNVKHILTHQFYGHYFPVTLLLHSIEHFFFGLNPAIYHAVNLLLHLLNVLLLYFVFLHFKLSKQLSLLAIAVFAIHPMHVETVAWIGARNNLLSAFFYLSAFLYYSKYIKKQSFLDYFVSFLLITLGVFSKSSAVTFVLFLIGYDFLIERRFNLKVLVEKIPFLLISVIAALAAVNAAKSFGSIEEIALNYTMADRPFLITFPIWIYLSKLFVPHDLRLKYHNPAGMAESLPIAYYLSFGVLLILAIMVFVSKRNLLKSLFLLFVFAINISLVLKINYSTNVIAAERYAYLSYVGLIPFVLVFFRELLKKYHVHRMALNGLIVLFMILFAYKTWDRLKVWQNSELLFESVIEQDPNQPLSYLFLAMNELKRQNYEEGVELIDKAILLDEKEVPYYYYMRGFLNMQARNLHAAEKDLAKSISLQPNYYKASFQLGLLYAQKSEFKLAKKYLEDVVEIDKENEQAYFFLGNIAVTEEDYVLAASYFEKSTNLNPSNENAWFNLGMCYYTLGKNAKACTCWIRASDLGMEEAIKRVYRNCK